MNVFGTLQKLWLESGFSAFFMESGWKNLIMILIAFVLLYLGIVKKFEPLLLCGIAFGCLLSNLSYLWHWEGKTPCIIRNSGRSSWTQRARTTTASGTL